MSWNLICQVPERSHQRDAEPDRRQKRACDKCFEGHIKAAAHVPRKKNQTRASQWHRSTKRNTEYSEVRQECKTKKQIKSTFQQQNPCQHLMTSGAEEDSSRR